MKLTRALCFKASDLLAILCASALLLGASSCATKGMLGGGPKDNRPPQVVTETPPLGSVKFKGDRIDITFDEYIKLKEPSKNILISPPLADQPEYKLRGKTLSVRFVEPLLDSTTYSIFFGDAITDLTEGNIYSGYNYVFSTGDVIDSLSISGSALDAYTALPAEGALTGLFALPDSITLPDSIVMKQPPRYITRCSKDGNYRLDYLAPGRYLLFALIDQNANYYYNPYSESFGFLDTVISLTYPTPDTSAATTDTSPPLPIVADTTAFASKVNDSLQTPADSAGRKNKAATFHFAPLQMFISQDSIQRITSRDRSAADAIRITYRYPVPKPILQILNPDSTGSYYAVYSANNDTLDLWLPNPLSDTVHLILGDSSQRVDTLYLPSKKKEVSNRRRQPQVQSLGLKSNLSGQDLSYFKPLQIITDQPVEQIDSSRWVFIANEDTLYAPLVETGNYRMVFQLNYPMKHGDNYKLLIADSAFRSIMGRYNRKANYSFTISSVEEYGLLRIKISTNKTGVNHLLYWMSENDKILGVYDFKSDTTLTLTNLQPGKYKVKAVLDSNGNRRWDTGDYMKMIQPEATETRPGFIEIRANWELEEEWKLAL